jgi:hypothetical protein
VRDAKGFTCWTQFVSMRFCQLGRADSLRQIYNGAGCCLGRFEDLFFTALARFREQQGLGTQFGELRVSPMPSGEGVSISGPLLN